MKFRFVDERRRLDGRRRSLLASTYIALRMK
jgi:hypothetical protein